MAAVAKPWKTEAEMVADFSAHALKHGWTPYAETAGWDLLLVRDADGFQIGVEAKLVLNATVLIQVLLHGEGWAKHGPDCHAVLVPSVSTTNGLAYLARRLGIVVITGVAPHATSAHRQEGPRWSPTLPEPRDDTWGYRTEDWPELAPDQRCPLPDYVPDVTGGHPSPVALTPWKVKALKAVVLMEERGSITRADFVHLRLSPSRWTQFWLCSDGAGGWVPSTQMPDFKRQHPVNYEQIKADLAKWAPPARPTPEGSEG